MSVRVKICGLTSVADARYAVQAGADLIGLNFYPQSRRAVSETTAKDIRAVLPDHVLCVGVFVNAARTGIAALVESLELDAIQFHGDEDATALEGWSVQTIQAVRVQQDESLLELSGHSRPAELGELGELAELVARSQADYVLLDTYRPGRYGGTGKTFAWEQAASLPIPFLERTILAGGLTPENVAEAVRTVKPWGIDVASGVESAPGRKDVEKLHAFIHNAKTAG